MSEASPQSSPVSPNEMARHQQNHIENVHGLYRYFVENQQRKGWKDKITRLFRRRTQPPNSYQIDLDKIDQEIDQAKIKI